MNSKIFLLALVSTLLVSELKCETLLQAQSNPFKAYVLTNKAGNVLGDSGVRIGLLDLKFETPTSLQKYNLPSNLVQKLIPYVGLSGPNAVSKLSQNPLTLNQQELNLLDKQVNSHWAQRMQLVPANVRNLPEFQRVQSLLQNKQYPEVLNAVADYRAQHPERI